MDTGTINVIDNKETLSFRVQPPQVEGERERGMSLTTGIRGFLNMVKVSDDEGFGLIRLSKIIYNGVELDENQKEGFWEQTKEKMNEHRKR